MLLLYQRKTIMRLLLLLLSVAFLMAFTYNKPSADLKRLAEMMEGSYNSTAQHIADTVNYFDIRLHIKRVWKERTDGYWFYVEQAVATFQHKPYRQRFYRLYQREDGKFVSEVYTIPDEARYVGAWKNPDLLNNLAADALTERTGCAVILRKQGKDFVGGTVGTGCASDLRGAVYATSEVTIIKGKMISWDRGYDDKGEQVWGATKGGYIFVKEKQK